MLLDLEYFQKNHINAVRTSHYPNQIPFYYMCDDLVNYDRENSNDLGLGVPPKGKHVFGITKVGEHGAGVCEAVSY